MLVVLGIAFVYLVLPANAIPIGLRSTNPLCVEATWEDIVVFILINYVTHAMTVSSNAGEEPTSALFFSIAALVLPFAGAMRGISSISSGSIFGRDPLQRAARADALCIVARSIDWHPQGKEEVHGCSVIGAKPSAESPKARVKVNPVENREINIGGSQIHGQYLLPSGYHLSFLYDHSSLVGKVEDLPIDIACSYSFPKIIASIVQLASALITLYHSRGTQLEQYGYAAFGLSVIQYALMSFVNLLGNLVCPNYPTLYMIRSEVMEEAETRGGRFIGTVGLLVPELAHGTQGQKISGNQSVIFNVLPGDSDSGGFGYQDKETFEYNEHGGATTIIVPSLGPSVANESRSQRWSTNLAWTLMALTVVAPYVIIAALTKFQAQNSTASQRGFMMSWLVVGQVGGFICGAVMSDDQSWRQRGRTFVICCIIFGAPSIGGFVIVVQMMRQFGYCVDI